jgi:hypothetical protein
MYFCASCKEEESPEKMLRIMHDVCMVDHAGCNSRFDDHETYVVRSKLSVNATIRTSFKGLSAIITARHGGNGAIKDWTNYGHWGEACALFAELITLYANEVKLRLHSRQPGNNTSLKLNYIALPQMRAATRNCGLADSHGIQALRARGSKYSEVFVALARAAVLPLQKAGVSIGSSIDRINRPSILFCDDVQPQRKEFTKAVVCFESIVEIGPGLKSHGVITPGPRLAAVEMPLFHYLVGVDVLGMNVDPAMQWSVNSYKRVVT